MRQSLEHFRNTRRLFESSERWLFLRKKPLCVVLSVYTNSENAIVLYLRDLVIPAQQARAGRPALQPVRRPALHFDRYRITRTRY
jgi:hypothetical protein